MAVELLGKAIPWRENPVLLVPLNDPVRGVVFMLATHPDVAAKGVNAIGLQIVLKRLGIGRKDFSGRTSVWSMPFWTSARRSTRSTAGFGRRLPGEGRL